MGTLDKIHQSEEVKSFLLANFTDMIKELQDKQMEMMEIYKNNTTFPFDFYNLTLREVDTKIQTIREIYKRFTDEDLE